MARSAGVSTFVLDVVDCVDAICCVMESDELDTLGARLSYVVALSGVDLATVDALAEITTGHTGQISRGSVTNPTVGTLGSIARVLGVSVDWLLNGSKKTAPGERRVRRAVAAARDLAVHAASVRTRIDGRKGRDRSAGRARPRASSARRSS